MEHESKPKFRINWRLFNILAKLLTVGVILWMCVNLVLGLIPKPFENQVGETTTGKDQAASEVLDANLLSPEELFADISSGAWDFANSDWKFSMSSEASGARLRQIPEFRRKANALFDDQATIQLFSDLDVKPETIGDDGMQIWRTEFHGISMVLFTLDSVVQLVRFRVPTQNGFSIMEGIPISRQRESGESLLPRCDGVSQLGVRRNPVGGVSSEVLEIEAQNKIDIRVFWKENGWDVRPLSSPLLAEDDGAERYHCSKGDAIIEASFLHDESSGKTSVVLTRIR